MWPLRDLVRFLFALTAASGFANTALGTIGQFAFSIAPQQSGLDAAISTTVSASGALIGDYNATTNPTGTRTMPGLFGPFGAGENVPVPARVGGTVTRHSSSDTAGSFGVYLDTTSGEMRMSGYQADFLGSAKITLPVGLSLQTRTFRTRNPSAIFTDAPMSLPGANASISSISVVQVAGGSVGTLSPRGANTFGFTITPMVQLTVTLDVLGNQFSIPGSPTPLSLEGTIFVDESGASISSVRQVLFEQSIAPGHLLPRLPMTLPTSVPGGSIAGILADLAVDQISTSINGTLSLQAQGQLVPAPSAAATLLGSAVLFGLRRRRR